MTDDPFDGAVARYEDAVELADAQRWADAEDAAREALSTFRREPGSPDVVNVLLFLADVRRRRDDLHEALALAGEAVDASATWPSDGDVLDRLRVQALRGLGSTLRSAGRYDEARPLLTEALRVAEERLGPGDADVASCCNELGILCKYTAAFDEGARHYERALAILGPDDVEAASVWHNIGGLHHAAGRPELAEAPARRAVELRTAALGPDHPTTVADEAALAGVLVDLGRVDEAEPLLRRSVECFERLHGRSSLEVAVGLHGLAAVAHARGEVVDAVAVCEEALRIKEAVLGNRSPELAVTLNNLGVLLFEVGRVDDAVAAWRRSLAVLAGVGPDHPARVAAEANLADAGV